MDFKHIQSTFRTYCSCGHFKPLLVKLFDPGGILRLVSIQRKIIAAGAIHDLKACYKLTHQGVMEQKQGKHTIRTLCTFSLCKLILSTGFPEKPNDLDKEEYHPGILVRKKKKHMAMGQKEKSYIGTTGFDLFSFYQ